MAHHPIITALDKISCQKETIHLFGSIFMPYPFRKSTTINLPDNGQQRPLYFLAKGLLHLSERTNNSPANKITKTIRFYQSGQFFVIPCSQTEKPCPTYKHSYQLSALTDSTLYQTTYQKIEELYRRNRNIIEIMLSIQDQWHQQTVEEISLLHQPAMERYQTFIQKFGLDHLHIPKKHLANYLLLSTKQLGRITRKSLYQS
ncbi:MAG: Crp/Fnr family transcriptional regulator [Pedobacter sp.]|nr:MAG: Crp/Fnr family transcriptional regulator [Pedobacter sp.]